MLESIHIRGYRSLRDFPLRLGRVTVVTGRNGVGKSNLYRALAMIQRMANGRLAEAIAEEGGMPSLLWAGERRVDEGKRVSWSLQHADFRFNIDCGLIPTSPLDPTEFKTDPDIKLETLHFTRKGRLMARRKGPSLELRGSEGNMETLPLPLHAPESMVSEVRDAIRFPALAAARETFLSWRFYHQFRTDPDAPIRRPQVGFWSPVLVHHGSNLAPTLQSIRESGKGDELEEVIAEAFPGISWDAVDPAGGFQLSIGRPGLKRSFQASELSDGTLRFFCLCAALITEKLPPFLVLNEPETSLHPELIAPLADLIARVPGQTQILVVTHSQNLADRMAEKCEAKVIELVTYRGETRTAGTGKAKRAWDFNE